MNKRRIKNLLIIVLFIIGLLSFIFYYSSKFPYDHPTLKVTSSSDDTTFYAPTNGGTWLDSYGGNSFDLGTYDIDKLSEINYATVSCNTDIKLDLSFTKDLKSFKVYSINKNLRSNKDHTEIEISNYTITTPKDPGTYGYVVETEWDDTHNIRFIFKIKTV